MKALALFLALCATSTFADTYVHGHYRQDGTYVQPHYRSAPDGNPYNNYSTQGNTNPYTGQQGTVNPYNQPNPYQQQSCYVNSYGNTVCR